jgi:sugar lactone lactonase YvrE
MGRTIIVCFAVILLSLVRPSIDGGPPSAFAQAVSPVLKTIQPDTISAQSATFTLRVNGKHFSSGARVVFDGAVLESSRVRSSGDHALAEIDSSLSRTPGVHTIQVVNPDGLASEKKSLSVVEANPDLRVRLDGDAVQEGQGTDLELEITGEGFAKKSSKVYVVGIKSPKTHVISESRLTFILPSSLTEDAAYVPIVVTNKDGSISNTDIFFVVPRPASLESVSPETVEVGPDDFRIEVTGSGFKPGARILLNGNYLATTNPEEGLLQATVPGQFRSSGGQLFVRVEQEGIQSSDLTIVVPPTDKPFIVVASPTKIRQGEDRPAIWIVATKFGEKSNVFIDGQRVEDEDVRSNTSTLIKVRLSEELVSIPGSHTVQITDRDDDRSNLISFEVVPDVVVDTLVGGRREGLNEERCAAVDDVFLRRPSRLSVGPDGLVYVVDYQNHLVRSVNVDVGEVCSIAGTGLAGYSDSGDSPDFEPTFSYPLGIAIQADKSILVSDGGNGVLRRIRRAADGNVTLDTYAGANRFLEDEDRQKRSNSTRLGLEGFRDGDAADAAFRKPDDMAVAPDGSIYISDAGNHSIRMIRRDGERLVVNTIAGNGAPGYADGDASKARFNVPTGLALSPDGKSLFVADTNNHRIRRIDILTLRVETLAGSGEQGDDDGPSFVADFKQPTGLAMERGRNALRERSQCGQNQASRPMG